jgi:hypothetical protein
VSSSLILECTAPDDTRSCPLERLRSAQEHQHLSACSTQEQNKAAAAFFTVQGPTREDDIGAARCKGSWRGWGLKKKAAAVGFDAVIEGKRGAQRSEEGA